MTTDAPTTGAFSSRDWGLLSVTALMWGSSFLWIDIGIEHFAPGSVALIRVLFGLATLSLFPKARAKIERGDLGKIVALGVLWMGGPFLLFPIAEQWIDTSLAGMINGGVPIFAAVTAALVLRKTPSSLTLLGIGVGFAGVVAVSWPGLSGADSSALGVLLVLLATAMYGVAVNIAAPLQRKYGALPVLLRVQFVALLVTLVPGLIGFTSSDFNLASFVALIPLGCLGTALAFVAMATLVGRVGPARGSVTIYFVPIVAIVLGALFRSEDISPISLVGTALVLGGAFLASRSQVAR